MKRDTNFSYRGSFRDERLNKRCEQIAESIYQRGSTVIEQFNPTRKGVVGSCRFFNNGRVCLESLIETVTKRIRQSVQGKEVLCIEDTTEIDYTCKRNRIKSGSLGPLRQSVQLGFFIHPTLVVDASNTMPLGLSDITIWKRVQGMPGKNERRYYNQPLEEKESYRWVESIQCSKKILSKANHKIVIADREADIYALYVRLKDERTDMIIRMRKDRSTQEKITIREKLRKQPVKGTLRIKVKADTIDKRSAHTAALHIKYCSVTMVRPDDVSNKGTVRVFPIQVVQIKEDPSTVKKGESPIEWILLTTLPVNNYQDACKVVSYYSKRWMIEEFFALLKTRGLSLENSQLTDGRSLMKLAVVAMDVAIKIMQLTKGRNNESLGAEIVFSKSEIRLLQTIKPYYEGATEKQKNPFKKNTLAWSAWIIGRMGGWKGYQSESPPGNRTMKRGIDKLQNMHEMYSIMKKDMCRD